MLRNIGVLLELTPAERAKLLGGLDEKQCEELFHDWSLWARPDQTPPPGDWIYWLILAGRGAGKTRAGAEAVREWAKTFAIVNLIGATHDDVRDIMVLGESGLMAFCPRGRAAALRARLRPARLAQRRGLAVVLRRRARPAARQAAHEAVVRRTRGLAPSRRVRSGAARPAPRRQAAGGDHHDAAADQDHQAARRGQGRDRHARLDLRQSSPSRRGVHRSASPRATRAARSAARSCSPKSSRRRRARCGRAR